MALVARSLSTFPLRTSLRATRHSQHYDLPIRRSLADRAQTPARVQEPALYNDAAPMPAQPRQPAQQSRGGPHLLILGLGLVSSPFIVYFYWNYREEHMRRKKEAMLRDIRARVQAG